MSFLNPLLLFAALGALAFAVAMFPRAAAGLGAFFFYDTWMQNLTFRAWWFEQLRDGHFATWCSGMFAGYPLFADKAPLPPLGVLDMRLHEGLIVLAMLASGAGEMMPREAFIEQVWDGNTAVGQRASAVDTDITEAVHLAGLVAKTPGPFRQIDLAPPRHG